MNNLEEIRKLLEMAKDEDGPESQLGFLSALALASDEEPAILNTVILIGLLNEYMTIEDVDPEYIEYLEDSLEETIPRLLN